MNEQITNVITKSKSIFSWIGRNIILLGFLICMIIIVILWMQNKSLNKSNDIKDVQLMMANDSAKEYKTKTGQAYFKFNAKEIEANALRVSLDASDTKIKDLRAENIKWRNIISVQQAQLLSAGHITTNVHDSIIHDTIPGTIPNIIQKINWTNHYLTLNAIIKDKVFDADYIYKINLKLISEKKGKSFIVTGIIDDPNAKIITGSQIIVTPTTHWWNKNWIWGVTGIVAGYVLTR